jgi:hypothetical protein
VCCLSLTLADAAAFAGFLAGEAPAVFDYFQDDGSYASSGAGGCSDAAGGGSGSGFGLAVADRVFVAPAVLAVLAVLALLRPFVLSRAVMGIGPRFFNQVNH